MLRNRTRTATGKQALMADQAPSLSPPSPNQTRPKSSIFGSPRFINGGCQKCPSELGTTSPTSILDVRPFSPIPNQPFGYDKPKVPQENPKILHGNKHTWENEAQIGIGLALIEDTRNNFPLTNTREVLSGSKLKIQIPPVPTSPLPPTNSPQSPGDFGTKTRNSPFGILHPIPFQAGDFNSPRVFNLSATEMELSEEYTRVISHGSSPRTVHIYDDCVLESCNGVVGLSELKGELSAEKSNSPLESFLSCCCTCKKSLEQGKDIYMYRGEKGFCSQECRCKEMLSDGEDSLE